MNDIVGRHTCLTGGLPSSTSKCRKDGFRCCQPLIKEAQEKLKGRPAQEIQQRTMAIYRENNVNMAGGCLPFGGR